MIFIIVMTDTAGLLFSVCCPAPLVPAQSARERAATVGLFPSGDAGGDGGHQVMVTVFFFVPFLD